MKAEIKGGQVFSYVDVTLAPGERLIAESDAMSSMSSDLDMESRLNGGLLTGLLRKYLMGETLFINEFTNNTSGDRHLVVVQGTPGEIRCLELKDETWYLQPGAFLACEPGVRIGLSWAGFASWIGGEGLFRIAVSGSGKVWFGAYGAMLEKDVQHELIVDTSHLVAYQPSVKLHMQLAGGLFSSFFGGEGLVTRLEGRGKALIQTRSLSGLADWINPKLGG